MNMNMTVNTTVYHDEYWITGRISCIGTSGIRRQLHLSSQRRYFSLGNRVDPLATGYEAERASTRCFRFEDRRGPAIPYRVSVKLIMIDAPTNT